MSKFYILIVIIIIGMCIKLFINDPDKKEEKKKSLYKYKRKDFLITRPEHEFFDILVELFGNQYHIFTQVHLPTILEHKVVGQNWKGAFSHINQKSVDFVICDKADIKPLLAIELDDKSHDKEDRIDRDHEVERILEESDLPLLRYRNHGSFDKEEIKRFVLEKLK